MKGSTHIYHVTHIRNLASILEAGAVLSKHEMIRQKVDFQNIAYEHIQDRREMTMVYGAQGGCLHDYVPFHFAPRSPMLFTISKGNVSGYNEGQDPLIYLVSTAEKVAACGLSYTFTDGHATMAITEFFDDLANLRKIDWDIMKAAMWNDTKEDPDRKRRRQAEFLVHKQFPVEEALGIAVINARIRDQVLEILSDFGVEMPVKVVPTWYY